MGQLGVGQIGGAQKAPKTCGAHLLPADGMGAQIQWVVLAEMRLLTGEQWDGKAISAKV